MNCRFNLFFVTVFIIASERICQSTKNSALFLPDSLYSYQKHLRLYRAVLVP